MVPTENSFQISRLRICHWYVFRAMDGQAKPKDDLSIESKELEKSKMEMKKDAMRSFPEPVHTTCHEEFHKACKSYQVKYADQKDWISYLKTQRMT